LPSLLPLHLPRGTSCENTPRATPRSGKREVLLTNKTACGWLANPEGGAGLPFRIALD
jgi:hypothetical protein